jgi:hypothetical protein
VSDTEANDVAEIKKNFFARGYIADVLYVSPHECAIPNLRERHYPVAISIQQCMRQFNCVRSVAIARCKAFLVGINRTLSLILAGFKLLPEIPLQSFLLPHDHHAVKSAIAEMKGQRGLACQKHRGRNWLLTDHPLFYKQHNIPFPVQATKTDMRIPSRIRYSPSISFATDRERSAINAMAFLVDQRNDGKHYVADASPQAGISCKIGSQEIQSRARPHASLPFHTKVHKWPLR